MIKKEPIPLQNTQKSLIYLFNDETSVLQIPALKESNYRNTNSLNTLTEYKEEIRLVV